MSIAARRLLCSRLIFQHDTDHTDLLTVGYTQTALIALLLDVSARYPLEVTSVRSDHSDDSKLGPHSHANGYAVDLWPLLTKVPGDYMDAIGEPFADWLRMCSRSPWLLQVGLAGSAWTDRNAAAAGTSVFHDVGADHVHLGAE